MGKGTDKLYITHSEWASGDRFSASAGAGVSGSVQIPGANFRRLPFNFCAVSLQPFQNPVCTDEGITFDIEHILPWIEKHGTNPVDGSPLKSSQLHKLNFAKNDQGEYVDPVTYKVFTNNTHMVALKNTGNVFAHDTIERLNIKAKNWRDLLSDEEFTRKDIITLQDPQHLETRDLSSFKYLKDGTSTLTDAEKAERQNPLNNLNLGAMGNAAKVLKAKEAVEKARAERAVTGNPNKSSSGALARKGAASNGGLNGNSGTIMPAPKPVPHNAASHTTGKAAASFTSTGLTPHTSGERALLSEEDFMLKPKRVKEKGLARLQTSHGAINLELHTEHAPKAVWNFVHLAKKGYYNGIAFHRNIRNFMIQGGDPTGTGRGGQSIWGKPFADEYGQSPLKHDKRGVLSMANKGKNTNTSQWFLIYRATPHLDRKHTIFGSIVAEDEGGESLATLKNLEAVKTDGADRPTEDCTIEEISILIDPFEEFQKKRSQQERAQLEQQELDRQGGAEDDRTTWTGKRIRKDGTVEDGDGDKGVGKYLDATTVGGNGAVDDEIVEEIVDEWDAPAEPPTKKRKATGGFGNFDGW